ncbi:Heme-binding HMX1 [Hyphodiscus hymeniophilus]|uniref:Heme-binding HMX1 n=1 Tax=Hyphodiscus hymeniophilus TaxID=353542 RepID=A0A9P7AXD0_9HELO|nr:Heme-binding HMX1 [Hyphodiscus hymeniophilus]
MDGKAITTPSPLPTSSNSPYPLSERINISTRPVHSQLNRLILARLPLALPPHTTNPSTYISGLLHITPIYITFETLWQTILDAPRLPTTLKPTFEFGIDACDPSLPLVDSKNPVTLRNTDIPVLVHAPKVCSRTHSLLAHLRLPGLLRSGRLRADIRVLTGTPEHKIDEQLEAISNHGRLAEFIAHTKRSVETNPHVLLAYAWVLYMALFSGGRHLRASLQSAGDSGDFWNRDPSPVRPYSVTTSISSNTLRSRLFKSENPFPTERTSRSRSQNHSENEASELVPGLQFFNFMGDEDGEDIKREFKKRLTETEILLTSGEKQDIIDEAENIFRFMVEIVTELDSVLGTSEEDVETLKLVHKHPALRESRDSVAVAQERFMRKTKTVSEIQGEKTEERKRSFLEGFGLGHVEKLVRFADENPSVSRIQRIYGSLHVGERDAASVKRHEGIWIGIPFSVVLLALLAWFYTA